jgi:hypothetical protein
MTSLLVTLGASPAQADVEQTTALQYFAAHGAELLRTMIAANRPGAQRAAGHLSVGGNEYSPMMTSILQCAIEHRDAAGVDALLELGAKAQVDFAAYITSLKTRWDMRGTAEHNEQHTTNLHCNQQ